VLSRVRASLALLVAALLVAVTAIAYSDPIDPSWPGYWDDDDSDNAVVAIVSASALDVSGQVENGPPPVPGVGLPVPRVLEVPSPHHSAASSRAPPRPVAALLIAS